MRYLKFILIGLLAGGLILLGGTRVFNDQVAQGSDEQVQLTEVKLLSYSDLQDNSASLIAYGTVEAVQDQDLFFEMNGSIEKVYAQPGDEVKEGEILAKLDDGNVKAAVVQAEAAYDAAYNSYRAVAKGAGYYDFQSAENSLEMARIQLDELYDTQEKTEDAGGDGSAFDAQIKIQKLVVEQYQYAIRSMEEGANDETLAAQWAYVDQAYAGVQAAKNTYDKIYLRAPFDGEITTLPIYEGQYAFATAGVGKILNRDDIEAVTYLSSKDAAQISTENNVLVDDEYEAYVFGISTRIDDYIGKLKVRVQMDETGDLVLGDTVKIEIQTNKSDCVTLVPLSAVLFDEEDAYVFFYYDGKVYKRLVNAGDVLGNFVEIYDMPETSIVEDVAGLRSGQNADVVS